MYYMYYMYYMYIMYIRHNANQQWLGYLDDIEEFKAFLLMFIEKHHTG